MISRSSVLGAFPTKPLGAVVEFLDNMRRPVTESERRAGPYPYYGANGQQGTIDDFIFDEPLVLLAEDGGHFDDPDRGIAYRVSGKTWVNNHAHVLRPKGEIDLGFLCRVLENYDVTPWVTGTTRGKLTQAGAAQVVVPVPPRPEQQRIAEILDKADALRAKRCAALAQLDSLTQSIFLDMFGDAATNPKGWPVKRVGDITECLDRLRRPVTESDRRPGNVPYYGANGQQGWIDTALFNEPLVLVAEDGGYFDVPERGVAYRIDGPAWVNNHAHILRAIPEHVATEFLHRALRHFNFLPYISGTTRAKLTQGQLNAVTLFVPPLDLQREFGERVAQVERIGRATSSSGAQLDALFAALQHRAFRGEL